MLARGVWDLQLKKTDPLPTGLIQVEAKAEEPFFLVLPMQDFFCPSASDVQAFIV